MPFDQRGALAVRCRQQQRAGDRDVALIDFEPRRLLRRPVARDPLRGLLEAADLIEEEPEAVARRRVDRALAGRAHPERGRLLDRPRLDHDIGELPETTLVAETLA